MFSKQKISEDRTLTVSNTVSKQENKHGVPSIIAPDLQIIGNLFCSSGFIEIEGKIEGNVTCTNVTIRRSGSVKGDVTADKIHVDGEINGLVKGIDITISDGGRVTGVIMYESLSVSSGAYIDGQCKSSESVHRGNVQAINIHQENIDKVSDATV
jgi:cytoskeletal protein CcmA (bactofilin family)